MFRQRSLWYRIADKAYLGPLALLAGLAPL